jgi:DNA polymerase III sliding clamp (beta) subunit (PCNA family)
MNINRQEFLTALEIVRPGLSKNETIQQATSFCFMQGRVVTYNDELSISHPLANCEIEGAIKADKLYSFLNKIKKEELDLSIKENEVILTTGRAKAGLPLQTEIKLPLEEVSDKKKWKPLPENFLKFLSFAMTSCSKSQATPILTCVHVTKNVIEASDNYRMIQCNLSEELQVKEFLIPVKSSVEVIKLQPTKISEGKGWVHFQTEEGTVISCRVFEDKYPDLNSLLKVEGEKITFPKTLEEVLDSAGVFSKQQNILDESISLTLGEKRLKIRAESDEGWYENEVNMNYTGSPVKINVTPYLLKNIISETLDCVLSKHKLCFEGDGWKYITALRS